MKISIDLMLLAIIVFLLFLSFYFNIALLKRLFSIIRKKRSLSSKYGRITEQFFPLIEKYPYDSSNFRFIGSPVDGVQFNDDSIVFVEFKTADSKLSEKEKRIKEIVDSKRIYFRVFRIG
ncbi:MAG: Holliday junction resolvase-like protein [Candidatus Woesearchaeota archaeon]